MIGFIAPHTFTTRDYRQYSAIANQHTFHFTVAHTLGFSAFTSRILATDFSQSHCNCKSHMKSSLHHLIPFLPLFCSCQFNSSAPNPYPGRLASRNSTLHSLDYCYILPNTSYDHFARTTKKTRPVLLTKRVYLTVT
jgi:hypothetical protein